MKHKLCAFTIAETLVVLIVTLVVVASIFSVFRMVQTYFNKYKLSKNAVNDFALFDTVFGKEVFNADSLEAGEQDEIKVYIKDRTIEYKVVDSLIIRTESAKDTFYMKVQNLQLERINEQSRLISTVSFIFNVNKEIVRPFYTKRYASDTYLKYVSGN